MGKGEKSAFIALQPGHSTEEEHAILLGKWFTFIPFPPKMQLPHAAGLKAGRGAGWALPHSGPEAEPQGIALDAVKGFLYSDLKIISGNSDG
jgi:hypothetical protein